MTSAKWSPAHQRQEARRKRQDALPSPFRGRSVQEGCEPAQASHPSRRATDHPAANSRQSRVHLEPPSGQAIGTLPLP